MIVPFRIAPRHRPTATESLKRVFELIEADPTVYAWPGAEIAGSQLIGAKYEGPLDDDHLASRLLKTRLRHRVQFYGEVTATPRETLDPTTLDMLEGLYMARSDSHGWTFEGVPIYRRFIESIGVKR